MKPFLMGIFFFLTVCLGAEPARSTVKAVLFPFREAVISARIDSVISPYTVKLGEKFEAGHEIATLDSARLLIEQKRVKEQLAFARATYEDKVKLYEQKFTSEYEVKKSEFDYKILENDLAGVELNLSYCSIRAPFAGRIIEFLAHDYETVRSGQQLFRMIDDNQLLAVMNVPINRKNLTTIGSKLTLEFPTQKKTVTGTVYEVMPQADHRTETVRIRVLISNEDGAFTPGMTGVLTDGQ